VARRAWATALVGATASPALLISDLGVPRRFLNMLRMFKVTSPMSVGSWILAGFGTATAPAALHALSGGRLGAAGRAAQVTSAVLGMPLASYTAALVSNTAVPVWHHARHELPFVFAAGAAMSAGAAAVALYGTALPAGGLGLDETVPVPVVSVPDDAARKAVEAIKGGEQPGLSIGVPRLVRNGGASAVAPFSSRGLAFDGRVKPDLVAPGEKVLSCAAGDVAAKAARQTGQQCDYAEQSGTSMAAPHVSGVIAAFLSIRREFIGKPLEVKRIFLDSATPLGRERYFEGHGLVDLMRAIQSV
jgi:subtilisin family serine protease